MLGLALLVCGLFTTISCGGNGVNSNQTNNSSSAQSSSATTTVKSIELKTPEDFTGEEFDMTKVKVLVNYWDGSSNEFALKQEMISESDLAKLSTTGTHQITVNYLGASGTFTVTIKGEKGDKGDEGAAGKEVTFRVSEGYIQWQYVGATAWTNLVAIDTLKGETGATGSTGSTGTAGAAGKQITLSVVGTNIKWQYVGDNEWNQLVSLVDLSGTNGKEVTFQVGNDYIQWKYVGDEGWNNLVALSSLTGLTGATGATGAAGADAKNVVFSVSGTSLQWAYDEENATVHTLIDIASLVQTGADGREIVLTNDGTSIKWYYSGDAAHTNTLVSLSSLKGETGATGATGATGPTGATGANGREVTFRVAEGYIQWQYTGEASWTNLIEVSSLTGATGSTGATGAVGAQGLQGVAGPAGRGLTAMEIRADGHLWATYSDSATAVDLGAVVGAGSGTTDKYTITFSVNADETMPATFKATDYQNVNAGTYFNNLPIPTKTDYIFAGWFTGTTVNDGQFTTLTPLAKDYTLVARWTSSSVVIPPASDSAEKTALDGVYGVGTTNNTENNTSVTLQDTVNSNAITWTIKDGSTYAQISAGVLTPKTTLVGYYDVTLNADWGKENVDYAVRVFNDSIFDDVSVVTSSSNANTVTLPSAVAGNDITWTIDEESVGLATITGQTLAFYGCNAYSTNVTITAEIHGQSIITKDYPITVSNSVAMANEAADSSSVTFVGKVTAFHTSSSYYVESGSYGMYVYGHSSSGFAVGNFVKVTGTKTTYKGLIEISSNTVTTSEIIDYTPNSAYVNSINTITTSSDYSNDANMSRLVGSMTELTYVSGSAVQGTNSTLVFTASWGSNVNLYFAGSQTVFTDGLVSTLSGLNVGDKITLTNLIITAYTTKQLYLTHGSVATKTFSAVTTNETKTIEFLTINDLHGYIMQDSSGMKGLSNTAYLINQERAATPEDDVVLFGNGDLFQGTAVSNLTKGEVVIRAMEAMSFDGIGVGNHEFDWGLPYITNYFDGTSSETNPADANYPLISSNISNKTGVNSGKLIAADSNTDNVLPYKVITKNGIKIGLISCIGPLQSQILASRTENYNFDDVVESVRSAATQCKSEGAQMIAVYIHDGNSDGISNYSPNNTIAQMKYDSNSSGAIDANDKYLVDVVFNAHTHTLQSGTISRTGGVDMPVVQANANNNYVGYVKLTYDVTDDKTFAVKSFGSLSVETVAGTQYAANVETVIDDFYDANVATLPVLATSSVAVTNRSQLYDWAGNVMLSATGADYAICNTGGIRSTGGLTAGGNVTLANLYEINPFDNTVYLVEMTGADIYSYYSVNCDGSNIYAWTSSAAGVPAASALSASTDYYLVAVIDYVYTGAYFPTSGLSSTQKAAMCKNELDTGLIFRDLMAQDVGLWGAASLSWNPTSSTTKITEQSTYTRSLSAKG